MKQVQFDFSQIHSMAVFYQQFKQVFSLPDYFGNNLDALWDVMTDGSVPNPVEIEFLHFQHDDKFIKLKSVFEQLAQQSKGTIRFICKTD